MNQKVCDIKNRIFLILTDCYIHNGSVLLHDYAVHCHRKGNPLVFLHTAIIMGVKICKVCILI